MGYCLPEYRLTTCHGFTNPLGAGLALGGGIFRGYGVARGWGQNGGKSSFLPWPCSAHI